MEKILLKYTPILLLVITFYGCSKSPFLNAKPDNSLVVPSTLQDLQALLDNDIMMNGAGNNGIVPAIGEVGADNYYLLNTDYQASITPLQQNEYIWAAQPFTGKDEILDWDYPYRAIFYANIVLDGLNKLTIPNNEKLQWDNEKGSALFYRAFMVYQLAQVFAPPYSKLTSPADWGVPLRLEADVNEPIHRATVEKDYEQIISDLNEGVNLLPDTPLYKTRPSKAACYALLARTYQTMQDYDNALLYADSCLSLQNSLLDYNTLNPNLSAPVPRFNKEVIFSSTLIFSVPVILGYVDSILYNSYASKDLRKTIFFQLYNGLPYFAGSYDGSFMPFAGIATDEIYLIRAECYARKGNVNEALNDLNALLENRWEQGTFVPLTAVSAQDALNQILTERRKELVFRGLRWTDLRRLNTDAAFAITLSRIVNGQTYTLPANDPRYTYPIPANVISFHPDMPQNKR